MTAAPIYAPPAPCTVSWGVGGTHSTQFIKMVPRGAQDFSRPPVIFLHGGAGTLSNGASTSFDPNLLTITLNSWPAYNTGLGTSLPHAFLQAGYRLYFPYTGPNWCATTCLTSPGTGTGGIDDMMTVAAADGHPSNQCLIMGQSMGGGNMLAYTVSNSSKVVAAYGQVPLVSVPDVHGRSLLGVTLANSVEAQWTSSYATTSLGVSPHNNTASWTSGIGSKVKCVWGSDDTTVHYTTSTAFASAVPSITNVFLTGNNHFAFLDNGWDDYDPVRWFDAKIGRTR